MSASGKGIQTSEGWFFLRAESFCNLASNIDAMDRDPGPGTPVINFIIAAGVLCVYAGLRWVGPLVLLGGVTCGVLLVLSNFILPAGELWVGLSLVLVGGLGMFSRRLPVSWLTTLLVGVSVLHGYMYGQTLAEQESVIPTVLAGYLAGLFAVHYLIAIGSCALLSGGLKQLNSSTVEVFKKPQLACAMVAGVGITLSLNMLTGI